MNPEPLCKVFNTYSPANISLFAASTSSDSPVQEEPLQKSYAGSFDLLVTELAQVAERRESTQRQAAHDLAARHQAEAARNRRLAAKRATRLVKSFQRFIAETPAKIAASLTKTFGTPVQNSNAGLERVMADMNAVHAKMESSRQQDAVRERFQDLYAAANAGRLDAFSVAKLDALRCRAIDMGLRP
jgi:hypothetical protein